MINKPSKSGGGIFDKGNLKSASHLDKTIKGIVRDKGMASEISERLKGHTFESSGLSKDEAIRGLKLLQKEGKLTERDLDQLKKHL